MAARDPLLATGNAGPLVPACADPTKGRNLTVWKPTFGVTAGSKRRSYAAAR